MKYELIEVSNKIKGFIGKPKGGLFEKSIDKELKLLEEILENETDWNDYEKINEI